jgi:hypothetical protein
MQETETKLVGTFILRRERGVRLWDVYAHGLVNVNDRHLCRVEIMPAAGGIIADEYDFANPHKAYRVMAKDLPDVGDLNQIVKGEDLIGYLEAVRRARFGM